MLYYADASHTASKLIISNSIKEGTTKKKKKKKTMDLQRRKLLVGNVIQLVQVPQLVS